MQSQSRLAMTLIAGLVASTLFAADKPVAVVNGVAIPQAKMDVILKQVADRAPDTPDLRQKIRDSLITTEILSQEAIKQGLDKTPDVQIELEIQRQTALANTFVQNHLKANPVSDAAMKAEYDQLKAKQPAVKEYHARHILVKTEKEANDILAALKKGKKFEDLAKEKSEDTGSKVNGGDLSWQAPEGYVKEFSEAMVKLAKGEITKAPVKTQYGYHIIKLEDTRESKGPSFDEVKPQMAQQMQRVAVEKFINDLKAKAKVE